MKSAVRLTDIQLILLATAAQRDDGSLLPPPDTLGEGSARIRKAVESLIRRGFAEEVPIKKSADAWRSEGRRSIGVVITDAGRAAIGVEGAAPEEGGALTPVPVTSPTRTLRGSWTRYAGNPRKCRSVTTVIWRRSMGLPGACYRS